MYGNGCIIDLIIYIILVEILDANHINNFLHLFPNEDVKPKSKQLILNSPYIF